LTETCVVNRESCKDQGAAKQPPVNRIVMKMRAVGKGRSAQCFESISSIVY